MAIKRVVESKFIASGNIGKKFNLWEKAAARFSRSADKSFKRASRSASRFSSVTKGMLAATGITNTLALIQRGVGEVTRGFIAFDKAALGATVRFKDIGPGAADFRDRLKEVEKAARDAGASTEFTAAQAATGLDFLARAGFKSTEAMQALIPMINLATATGEDFASAADKSSDLLGAFGLNADTTAQKIKNLNRLNDVLVKTANSTNVTLETMFETMKTAGPVGSIIGASLEEVAAITGILGNAGIKGTEAGTAMKNMFLRLAAATPATRDMLQAIGVDIDDGTGKMKKFSVIMSEISGATKEFGNIKVAKVLDTLFGKRAIAGAVNIGNSIGALEDLEKTLLSAGLTSQQTADIMRTSIDAKLKSLGSAATEAGFKILSAFRDDGKGGIDALTEAIRNADMQPFIESLKVMATFLGEIAGFVRDIGGGLGIIAAKGVTAFENRQAETIAESSFEPSNFFRNLFSTEDQQGFQKREFLKSSSGFSRDAPNLAEATARAQQSTFSGSINVNGPPGTTVSTEQSVPGFEMALGAN